MAWIKKRKRRDGGFKKMVDAAGQRWPDGWVQGEGFVLPPGESDPLKPPPFVEIGEEYVRQIVDLPLGSGALPRPPAGARRDPPAR